MILEYSERARIDAFVKASFTANLDESGDRLSGKLVGKGVDPQRNTLWSNAGSFNGERVHVEPID